MEKYNSILDKAVKVAEGLARKRNVSRTATTKVDKGFMQWYTVSEFLERYKWYEYNRGNGTDINRAANMAIDIAVNNTGWLLPVVIADSETKEVLDANHSSLAAVVAHQVFGVDLGLWVVEKTPVDSDGNRLPVVKAVQMLNNSREGWSLDDYVKSFINDRNKNYIRLQRMADELGEFFVITKTNGELKYQWRYASALAGCTQQSAIREGAYTLSEADKKAQIEIGKEIIEFWELMGKPKISGWIESFIFAWVRTRLFYANNIGQSIERMKAFLKTEASKEWLDATSSTKVWRERFMAVISGFDE